VPLGWSGPGVAPVKERIAQSREEPKERSRRDERRRDSITKRKKGPGEKPGPLEDEGSEKAN
jgi:hypothetical protein